MEGSVLAHSENWFWTRHFSAEHIFSFSTNNLTYQGGQYEPSSLFKLKNCMLAFNWKPSAMLMRELTAIMTLNLIAECSWRLFIGFEVCLEVDSLVRFTVTVSQHPSHSITATALKLQQHHHCFSPSATASQPQHHSHSITVTASQPQQHSHSTKAAATPSLLFILSDSITATASHARKC